MAEQLEELQEAVRQLQADKERLTQELASRQTGVGSAATPESSNATSEPTNGQTTRSGNAGSTERVLYLPRERKCPMFRGRVGISIDEWLEEVNACVRVRHLGSRDKAYFMFDHLESEARDEIKYRPREEREDPDKIETVLKELYGCSKSYVALQENFFSRKQLDGESLQEYSHALLSLMDQVKQCSPESVSQADKLLRDQFAEHVLDSDLRRELKRQIRQNPRLSMLEVRAEAIRWEREGRPNDAARGRSHSVPSLCAMQCTRQPQQSIPAPSVVSEMAELRAIVLKQQEQINQLINLNRSQPPPRPARSSRPFTVICRRCQKPGHYARECQNECVVPAHSPVPQSRHEDTTSAPPAGN